MTSTDTPEAAPATAVEDNEVEQAVGAQAQQANEVAQETGAAAPQPVAEVAPTEADKATIESAPFATFIEDADPEAPAAPAPTPEQAQPETIKLQESTPEELAAAKAAEEKLAASHPSPSTIAPAPVQPAISKTTAEIEAGRRRVAEHESRATLAAAKAASEGTEGQNVAAATAANKDL